MFDYIGGSYATSNTSFGFPVGGGQTYRHPFIKNAMEPNPSLRAWMREFVRAYRVQQNTGPWIPDPSRILMDVETGISHCGSLYEVHGWQGIYSANDVRMLEQLYESRLPQHRPYPDFWSTEPVPGDPGWPGVCAAGMCTLKQIYLRDKAKFNLPVYAAGHPEAGDPDLRLLASRDPATQAARPASHIDNRRFLLWWQEVTTRTVEHVMARCCYSVVHEGIPDENPPVAGWPTAKVSNYDSSLHDGLLRTTTVMQESTCAFNPADDGCWTDDYNSRLLTTSNPPSEPHPDTTVWVNQSPSCTRVGRVDGAGFYRMNPGQSERRWGGIVQSSTGDLDSPVIYPLAEYRDQWKQVRQRNAYARVISGSGKNLLELRHEAGLRLHRHELESTVGGYRLDNGGRLLVPWVYVVGLRIDDFSEPPSLMSVAELAHTFALLRSKRVKEAIPFNSHPFGSNQAKDFWNMTELAIKDVYSPVVERITYRSSPGTTTSTTDAGDLATINDTLLDTGDVSRTFNVNSVLINDRQVVSLEVKFDDAFRTASPHNLHRLVDPETVPGMGVIPGRDFFVNVECAAFQGHAPTQTRDTTILLKVSANRRNDQMFMLSSLDGEATVSSGRNSLGETRCFWHVPNSRFEPQESRVDPSKVLIEANAPANHPFHIKFDLVQVIPYHLPAGARIDGGLCDPPVDLAVNRDGAHALEVEGNHFQSSSPTGGFKVVWDKALMAEHRGEMPENLFIRLYRYTGDAAQPLADVTCSTEQTLTTMTHNNETKGVVYVRYRPNPSAASRPLPPGVYSFCTYTCPTQINSMCRDIQYPTMRTVLPDINPIEWHPRAASELFVIKVPGEVVPGCDIRNLDCPSDVDDGNMSGLPDGGVSIDDLLYYMSVFDQGSVCADVDDGLGTGTPDGGVTIEDLLYYLARFDAGC